MTDETSASTGGEGDSAPIVSNTLAADAPAEFTTNQAAKALADLRWKRNHESSADSAPAATAEPELAQANADPETAPSEDTTDAEPAGEPPIEPPRSWTQAEKERFQSLPRETQEYLHTREQEREREFRRSQNEAAEERKAAKAERDAAEKARQQYEAQLPSVMQALQDAQNGAFADIRTVDDVQKLANEDPFRYLQWQAHQTKLQAVNAEVERANHEKARQQQTEAQARKAREHALLIEAAPEFADASKLKAAQDAALQLFRDKGFTDNQLAELGDNPLLDDHRFQLIVSDALKYREVQKAKVTAATKPVPPVQRPGTSKPPGSSVSERVQALDSKLSNSGSLKDAQALLLARRQRRAS